MSKEELSPKEKREKIKELILEKEYGETLTYEQLNSIIQEDLSDYYGRNVFKRLMNKVKNELFEKGVVIRPVYNIGYYILKPNQVASYTYRNYIVKPLNSFKKARTILENTDRSKLKGQEITEHNICSRLNKAMDFASNELLNDDEYKVLKGNGGKQNEFIRKDSK